MATANPTSSSSLVDRWKRAWSTMSTYTTALPSAVTKAAAAENLTTGPITDVSTGRLVIDRPGGSIICIALYGTDSDNQTVNLTVNCWDRLIVDGSATRQWIPYPLWIGTATLSGVLGPTGGIVSDSHRFADTFTTTTDRALSPLSTRIMLSAGADEGLAMLVIDPLTCERVEIQGELGTAASFNLLYKIGG